MRKVIEKSQLYFMLLTLLCLIGCGVNGNKATYISISPSRIDCKAEGKTEIVEVYSDGDPITVRKCPSWIHYQVLEDRTVFLKIDAVQYSETRDDCVVICAGKRQAALYVKQQGNEHEQNSPIDNIDDIEDIDGF